MIARLAAPFVDWLAAHRRRQMEETWRDPVAAQEVALRRLVAAARDTEFGLSHGFAGISSVSHYQSHVPVREYRDFRSMWTRAMAGERDITWPGAPAAWAKTSGTTPGDKLIPVTREALASHRMGGWAAVLRAVSLAGSRELIDGHALYLGGSAARPRPGEAAGLSARSGLALRHPPLWLGRGAAPDPAVGAGSWEARLEAAAEVAASQDVRMIAGMPSWLIVFFERLALVRERGGRRLRDLHQLWPRLGALIHGGLAYAPYAAALDEWVGARPLHRIEVYPACEGFVAVQTESAGGLTLMLDYGNFYEFVPAEDVGSPTPRRQTVADVEIGRPYAVVMSTPAGLWSYLLGDIVRFTARDPLRLVVTGRTQSYVNASGEHVSVEEVERAVTGACRRTGAELVEFTVAPRDGAAGAARGGHEWLVEFRVPPGEPGDFLRIIDESLARMNSAYRARRAAARGLVAPTVTVLARGTFHRWMRQSGNLGLHQRVPRATNDRTLAEALLAASGAFAQPLVSAAS